MTYIPATKTRINRKLLADMPAALAEQVTRWQERYRKAFVRIQHCTSATIDEDGRYTAYSPDCRHSQTARAAGEWAGHTGLAIGAICQIPPSCTLVEESISCGEPFLTIFHNPNPAPVGAVESVPVLCG